MAGQALELLGNFTSGDWDKGVNTTADQITYVTEGTRATLLTTAYNDAIAISEDGSAIIQLPSMASTNTANYVALAGTTDGQIQTAFEWPNNHRIIFKTIETDTEWFHYDNGGTFPYNGGVQTFDEFLGDYSVPDWDLGVDTVAQEVTFFPAAATVEGSLYRRVVPVINNEMICISETNNIVIQQSVSSTLDKFHYDLLDGATNVEVQTNFESPNRFRIILKDTDPASEWFYYDAGGAFPFVPALSGGETVTRMEGFGSISDDSADLIANGWAAAGGTRSIAGGRFGGNGYKLNALTQVIAEFGGSVAAQARWGVTYWANWTNIGAASNIYHLSDSAVTGTMPSGNTAHANVALNADGSLELFTAGVSRDTTAAGAIVAATDYHIEIRVFIDNVGTAEVWLDGVSVLSATSVDTLLGTTTNVTTNLSGGNSTECIIDDLLLVEGSVAPLGLHQIHELLPTGAGTNTAWTGTFADVDDPLGSPDGDTTVITSAVALTKQDHTFPALPGGITEVFAVELLSRARVNESAPFDLVQYSISGATETDFPAHALLAGYAIKTDRHNLDPDTAVAWTVGGVNALKAGDKVVDS